MPKEKFEAFDYGEYDRLCADPRTKTVLKLVDEIAIRHKAAYAIVGGLASYLYVKNPPEDYPDIDIILYCEIGVAKSIIISLLKQKNMRSYFIDDDLPDAIFAALVYDDDIQIDLFTSDDERESVKTRRIEGVDVKPVEPLIIEKLIRSTPADVRMAIDLLAFVDYDRQVLDRLAREYRLTPALHKAIHFARRLSVGAITKTGMNSVVARLARN